MRDVMCNGYVAGGNTRFFGQSGSDANKNGFTKPVEDEEVQEALDKRLSFQDDASGEYDSLLAFGAPYGDGAKRDQVISITDRLLPWEVTQNPAVKDYFPGGDSNYRAYKNCWKLNTIHFGEDVRAAENMEFISQGSMNNGLCFVGPHRKYNPFSNQYHQLIPGQGHFVRRRPCAPRPCSGRRRHAHSNAPRCLCARRARTRSREMLGGDGERRSRSRRPATRWCRSRSRRTRRCS